MNIYIAADFIAEALCLLTAVCCFKGLRAFGLLPFIPFLLVVCSIEGVALQLDDTREIYNFYVLASALFYWYCYGVLLGLNAVQRRWYRIAGFMLVSLIYLNYLFKSPEVTFTASGMMVTELALICLSCIVLYQIALSPDGPPLFKDHRFIIAAVTFIHCLGGIIIFNFHGRLDHRLGRIVNELTMSNLNLVMYPGYIYSFYLCQQQRARSSG